MFKVKATADSSWCYKEGKPKFGAFVLAELEHPTSV